MLSDALISEFSRNTPFTKHLVRLAWPSLSVEAKLQVIAAHQTGYSASTPDWLTDLALDDAPIVQYFGLRYAYLRDMPPPGGTMPVFNPPTEADAARYRRAQAIEDEVVRAALLNESGFILCDMLTALPQLQRLAAIRNAKMFSLDSFIEWLADALKAGVPDEELASCACEFLARAETKADLGNKKGDFVTGEAAYRAGKAMEQGWELLRTAGPMLTTQLFWSLPTSLGLTTMKPEQLATLPEQVLRSIVTHYSPTPEMGGVRALVDKNPERYPDSVVKALERERSSDYEIREFTDEERTDRERLVAPDSVKQTLEVVLQLKERLDALRQELLEVKEAASARRGFFG